MKWYGVAVLLPYFLTFTYVFYVLPLHIIQDKLKKDIKEKEKRNRKYDEVLKEEIVNK